MVITSQNGDAAQMVASFEQARTMRTLAPGHYDTFTGGETFRSEFNSYAAMTGQGTSPEVAVDHIKAMRDPENAQNYKQLKADPAVEKSFEAIDADYLRDQFDTFEVSGWKSMAWGKPELGETLEAQNHMIRQYKGLYETALSKFSRAPGMSRDDMIKHAQAEAFANFQKQNAVSEMTFASLDGPSNTVTAFPVEATQPVDPVNKTHDWVRLQAHRELADELVNALGIEATADMMPASPEDIFLVPDHNTKAAAVAGKPVPYVLSWRDANGTLHTFHAPFIPEMPSMEELTADKKHEWIAERNETLKRLERVGRLSKKPLAQYEEMQGMRDKYMEVGRPEKPEVVREVGDPGTAAQRTKDLREADQLPSTTAAQQTKEMREAGELDSLTAAERLKEARGAGAPRIDRKAQEELIGEISSAGKAAYDAAIAKGGTMGDANRARDKAIDDFLKKRLK